MASDVEDPSIYYTDLPSIFENNSNNNNNSSSSTYNEIVTDVNKEKSYQPIFGSFLFADSDPLSRAAFVTSSSSSPSIEIETTHEQQMEDFNIQDENDVRMVPTLSPSTSIEDIDEDDFDGIPLRHSTPLKKTNGDKDFLLNHTDNDHLFEQFIEHIEDSHDDNDLEDETFLNGFNDEQHETTITVPSLFKNIPDIDDLNEHDDEDDNDDRVPFDNMDMSDQSNSIRSSSPDSLLSSSNLQDDDNDIDDQEVEQWNDEHILHMNTSNKDPQLIRNFNNINQVDFIDTSRSNSRCSDASLDLNNGYADQAHTFLSDDEHLTSSDSDNDDEEDNNNNSINMNCDNVNPIETEDDICLQVNLDNDQRSISPYNHSNSSNSRHSSLSNPDETPIMDIDEDPNESNNLQVAPIAALDDEDEDDLETSISNQPILPYITSNIKNIFDLKNQIRQNDIVHDIINIRHLLNENNQNDEFIAVMHNPKIFEQVIYENNHKKFDLVKQTNSVTSTFRSPTQLSNDNKIKNESFEHYQNIHQTPSLLESNNEKIPNSSLYPRKITTNNSTLPDVNHLLEEGKENNSLMHVLNNPDDILIREQKREQLHCRQTNTSNNAVKNHQIMDSDNESEEDDLELLKTLSQIHGIMNSEQMQQTESQVPTNSSDINQEQTPAEYLSKNRNNETELLNEKKQVKCDIILSSPYVIETIKQADEEREEKNEKKNVIIYKNHNDVDGDDKQREKYEQNDEKREEEEEKGEEKKATTFFSLTSSTSPFIFNDDSHSPVVILNPDASSILSNIPYESNNQLITEPLQISKTKSNMNNLHNHEEDQQTTNLFDPFAPTETMYDDNDADDSKLVDDDKNQPLANYNFDDLWNQSISNLESSNEQIDPNTFDWNNFFNSEQKANTNPFDDEDKKNSSGTDITWDALFNEDKQQQQQQDEETKDDLKEFLNWILDHLQEKEEGDEEKSAFFSTLNLESIIKDMQMSVIPFDPIPSPPLHVDHTVSNPLINGVHHDLFPINELEQTNIFQGQQSMTLYEEDENEIEEQEETNISSFDDDVQPMIEKLVSNVLDLALKQVNQYYEPIEHFVDQIISQAVFEIYHEEQEQEQEQEDQVYSTENLASIINQHNEIKTTEEHEQEHEHEQEQEQELEQEQEQEEEDQVYNTENLASIINEHNEIKTTEKQILDPFDQKFDTVWSQHFQAPDEEPTTNENLFENQDQNDPWLETTTGTDANQNSDPIMFFNKTFDESDLFSSSSSNKQIPDVENDQTATLSEYLPSPLLTKPSATMDANNIMKYTLTAPVIDDSGDDSSTLEDYFISRKNESAELAQKSIDEQSNETNDLTKQKEMEINDQENFFTNKTQLSQFEAFASVEPLHSPEIESKFADLTAQLNEEVNQFSQVHDDAPWTSVEKPTSPIGNDEPWELEDNAEEKLSPVPTTVRLSSAFNDNEYSPGDKNNRSNNFFSDSFNPAEDSEQTVTKTVRFSDNIENIRISTPPPPNDTRESSSTSTNELDDIVIEHIQPTMETSFINIDEKDFKDERPYGSNELTSSTIQDLTTSLDETSNTTNDNIPLKSEISSSNPETQYKINLRSEPEITTTDTNRQLSQSTESVILRPTTNNEINTDPDEVDGVIRCVIDKIPINIDAKSINPFKCVVSSAGTLEDNQTAVIAIYGCALPDHRLREYRYIMDQLFYYVYYKLEKLVINDYILIYFHGATPKHRTPDLKFLRKYYQMMNFRLRKNLRSVYVVHPTRLLRTVIALSRPFFSKKFYHKINYIYTVAELQRRFPNNCPSIPNVIEQTDWLYSQKYDRDNASINRSISQGISQIIFTNEDESAV